MGVSAPFDDEAPLASLLPPDADRSVTGAVESAVRTAGRRLCEVDPRLNDALVRLWGYYVRLYPAMANGTAWRRIAAPAPIDPFRVVEVDPDDVEYMVEDGDGGGGTADDGSGGASADASAEAQADVTFGTADDAADEASETVDAADATEEATTADDGAEAEAASSGPEPGTREAVVATLRRRIEDLPPLSREMLAHYREAGQADPVDAHVAAGGTPKQTLAYGRNRPLRRAGLIEHVEQDTYRYALPDRVAERFDGHLDGTALASVQRAIEESFVDEAALGGKTVGPRASDAADAARHEHDVPDEERTDVEMLPDDETVEPDDGFVTEDVAIIDDADDEPTTDDDDGNPANDDADDGGDTGPTSAAEEDTGGVEIL